MTESQRDQLVQAALAARDAAYAPYSKFSVGAALLAADGRVFTGVNVENSSFGLTICAERTAVFSAVTAGVQEFAAVAVAAPGGAAPCGACRQVLCEFSPHAEVLLADSRGEADLKVVTLADLLPARFHLKHDA
ncbi:MAG: cytidine deaminase [Planctomycetota bacterium]